MSNIAKRIIWRLESDRYALTQGKLYELGQQLPNDYYGGDPSKIGYKRLEHLRGEAAKLFFETDMWFVKVSLKSLISCYEINLTWLPVTDHG